MQNFYFNFSKYSCRRDLNDIVANLEIDVTRLLKWFAENYMVANTKKFQLKFLGFNTQRRLNLNIRGNKVSETDYDAWG